MCVVVVKHEKKSSFKCNYYTGTVVWQKQKKNNPKTITCDSSMYGSSDLFAAWTNSLILKAAVLLITKMASKIFFDQFSSCRKLFSCRFYYVTVNNSISHFPGHRVLPILHGVDEVQENSPLFSPFLQLMRMNICNALGRCFPVLHCIRNQGDK